MGCAGSAHERGIKHPLRAPMFPKKASENIDFHSCHKYCNEEIVKSWFKAADTDGSGAIDFEEFKKSAIGKTLSNEEARRVFVSADLDKDGQIDYNEFVAALDAPKAPLALAANRAGMSSYDLSEEPTVRDSTTAP
jgi:hypothetical protein